MLTPVRLPDGAVVEIAEYGDPAGFPVIFQPGTPGTAGAGEVVAPAASRHGIRLVAISRPGYGASTVAPPGLAHVAEQVAMLAGVLDLDRFGVWGLSGGGPFALAQAAVTPHRVTRVVVTAGPAQGEPADAAALTAEAIETGELFAGLDDEALWSVMSQSVPPNEHFFRDHPDLRPAFVANMRLALARPDGYVRDELTFGSEWDVDLAAISAPVDLIYGETDQMVPRANGDRLAAAIPHARLDVLDGGHGDATFGSADRALGLMKGDSVPGA
jgi:pimeloyl-ACP methyl ester carboxylesterase